MKKRVAILQSNYIPWKGYFDLIAAVDEFILFDDMQFTRRDWRNRNIIKTPNGLKWLTIPVKVKGKYFQAIKDTEVSDDGWALNHWQTISNFYSRAPHFNEYKLCFEELYLNMNQTLLSQINRAFLEAICQILNINTKLSWSMDCGVVNGKTERLVDLCLKAGASEYISGPSAKDYINDQLFIEQGISVRYMDYGGYPEYAQLFPPFEHGVPILDLIFKTGPNMQDF